MKRYKFGSSHDNEIRDYDWFIIDTYTDTVVENIKSTETLSNVRKRCNDWNNDVVNSDKILPKCTRVEVIDTTGRAYVNWQEGNIVQLMMQDDDRTLKIFISSKV
jgi:hypothetical protein